VNGVVHHTEDDTRGSAECVRMPAVKKNCHVMVPVKEDKGLFVYNNEECIQELTWGLNFGTMKQRHPMKVVLKFERATKSMELVFVQDERTHNSKGKVTTLLISSTIYQLCEDSLCLLPENEASFEYFHLGENNFFHREKICLHSFSL